MKLTKAQQHGLLRLWQHNDLGMSFLEFRRGAKHIGHGWNVVVVRWPWNWVFVQADGTIRK